MQPSASSSCATATNLELDQLRKGHLIQSDALDDQVKEHIQDSRVIQGKRGKGLGAYLVVLSQDCDIGNSKDKCLEVVVGKILTAKKADRERGSRFDKPINYQKLIVRFGDQYLELHTDLISVIEKSELPEAIPCAGQLDEREIQIVTDWRVGRYNREPFPHEFNLPFKTCFEDLKLWEFFEEHYQSVVDIFVYVDPRNDEHSAQYDVSVTALLDDDCPDEIRAEIESRLTQALRELASRTKSDDEQATLYCGQVTGTWFSEEPPPCTLDLVAQAHDVSLHDLLFLRRFNTAMACYPDTDEE